MAPKKRCQLILKLEKSRKMAKSTKSLFIKSIGQLNVKKWKFPLPATCFEPGTVLFEITHSIAGPPSSRKKIIEIVFWNCKNGGMSLH